MKVAEFSGRKYHFVIISDIYDDEFWSGVVTVLCKEHLEKLERAIDEMREYCRNREYMLVSRIYLFDFGGYPIEIEVLSTNATDPFVVVTTGSALNENVSCRCLLGVVNYKCLKLHRVECYGKIE